MTGLAAPAADPDPGLALGRGLPDVPWTIRQPDRIYNLLLAGGQGSGKSSLLLRLALTDILAPNTATVVLDMKGSLSERLLGLTPPEVGKRWWDEEAGGWQEGTKRLWYLDLARPGFGLTPLRVEAPWSPHALADEFARIADAITRALLYLFPGQIMGSSEDLIERAVVGTMAIAWHEHERRCRRDGADPTTRGFSGSFEVLSQMFAPSDRFEEEDGQGRGRRRVRPNRWHQAAGRVPGASQPRPGRGHAALRDPPPGARQPRRHRQADGGTREQDPAARRRRRVGQAVRRPPRAAVAAVGDRGARHPDRQPEDRADRRGPGVDPHQLRRPHARPAAKAPGGRAPVAPAAGVAGHRRGAPADHHHADDDDRHPPRGGADGRGRRPVRLPARRGGALGRAQGEDLKGVGNLLQSKVLFRMSDSEDADRHTQIFRSVYETMVRADPTSRARMPFDPARMQTLRDHHALVSLVSTADPANGGGLVDGAHGATRLPAFVTETYAMPDVEQIPDRWRAEHLARQRQVFTRYPEDMSSLAVADVPAGLDGAGPVAGPGEGHGSAAAVERRAAGGDRGGGDAGGPRDAGDAGGSGQAPPARAARPPAPGADEEQPPASGAGDGEPPPAGGDGSPADGDAPPPRAPPVGGGRDGPPPLAPAAEDHRDRPPPRARAADGTGEAAPPPGWERVGGVRIERAEDPPDDRGAPTADSPVLRVACRPTARALPGRDLRPAREATMGAVREAATFEAITGLPAWEVAGDEARARAAAAASAAREQSLVEGQAAGADPDQAGRTADRRARRAAGEALATHPDAPWRTPVKEVQLGDADAHTLELIARLRFTAPAVLTRLLFDPAKERALRDRLVRLHDAGLIARAEVAIQGRRGRRPRLYAVAPRGLEYLRLRHAEMRPEHEPAAYLSPTRKLPTPGRGREVPHELAVQLALVALRQYGGTSTRLHWHTTRMPGGRWDVGMVHADRRDRALRLADLAPAPGLTVHGERLDAPPTLEPDLSVQLQGRVDGERAVIDLLLEVDRTGRGAYNAPKYAAYDHFLGGWSLRTRHWGRERQTRPVVVFVAQAPKAMLTLLHAADQAMTLGFGARGRYQPSEFAYPGRAHTAFTCLDWLLAGQPLALRLPELPPTARGRRTELQPERVALLPEEWWPQPRRP